MDRRERLVGGHQPLLGSPLWHEYQFGLSLADSRIALDRIVDFLNSHIG